LNPSGSRSNASELAVSLGVVALGIGAAAVTATLPSEGGYAGIGPNFIPTVVSAGLLVLGVWLTCESLTGGWRNRAPQAESFEKAPFLWVSAGLFAHMALIGWAGFVIAGTALFVCVARGFGSQRFLQNAVLGGILSLAVFLFFTKVLGVSLPAGWMPLPL
jgi:putative tricarboxylic transport membrane protein